MKLRQRFCNWIPPGDLKHELIMLKECPKSIFYWVFLPLTRLILKLKVKKLFNFVRWSYSTIASRTGAEVNPAPVPCLKDPRVLRTLKVFRPYYEAQGKTLSYEEAEEIRTNLAEFGFEILRLFVKDEDNE